MTKEMKIVCNKLEKVTGIRIVVQERAGIKYKSLAKSEPLKNKKCDRQESSIFNRKGGKCEKNGIGYEIKCEHCDNDDKSSLYEGKTGRKGFTRGAEHLAALRLESEVSPLWSIASWSMRQEKPNSP